MNFKIDTKEKFTVITPEEIHLSDNLTEQLINTAKEILQKDKSNVVLNLKQIKRLMTKQQQNLLTCSNRFMKIILLCYLRNANFPRRKVRRA